MPRMLWPCHSAQLKCHFRLLNLHFRLLNLHVRLLNLHVRTAIMNLCRIPACFPKGSACLHLTRKESSKLPSRFHRLPTFCESAGYGERYILHASFTHRSLCARFIASLQGDTHRASLRYERCFQYIRRKSVKAEPVRASVAANLVCERCVKDASFTTFSLSTASYTAVNV